MPPDDVQGDIRSACGLAKLLIEERFDQFNDLIRQAEECFKGTPSDPSAKVVKVSDLEGFWEMIEIQVKDVEKKFDNLAKLKANLYVPLPLEKPQQQESKPRAAVVFKKKVVAVVQDEAKKKMTEEAPAKAKPSFASFKANLMKKHKQQSKEQEVAMGNNLTLVLLKSARKS